MKKIVTTLLLLIIFTTNISSAYSTDKYSITVPSTFSKISEGYFINNNGESISIQVSPDIDTKGFKYNEENLNSYVETIQSMDFAECKEQIKKMCGDSFSDEQITRLLDSIDINITKKEITTFTDNNYKCFHIIYNASLNSNVFTYSEQYIVVGQNIGYILTITGNSKSFINSSEVKEIVNSFTLINFKEVDNIWNKVLIIILATLILSPLYNLMKNKENNINDEDKIQKSSTRLQDYNSNEEVKELIKKLQENNNKNEL